MANKDTIFEASAVAGVVDYEFVVVDSDGNANPPFNSPILSSALDSADGISDRRVTGADLFGSLPGGAYRVQVKAKAAVPAEDSDYSAVINVTYDPKLSVPTLTIV